MSKVLPFPTPDDHILEHAEKLLGEAVRLVRLARGNGDRVAWLLEETTSLLRSPQKEDEFQFDRVVGIKSR